MVGTTCRGVGVDGGEGRRAVAFAFGPQHSWQRFTVYFLCSDGAVFALCPVACFGAGVPASAVQALSEATAENDDLAHSGTTKAWLQQVHSVLIIAQQCIVHDKTLGREAGGRSRNPICPQIPLCRWKYCHLFACIV